MPAGNPRDTPAMRQHARFKRQHPDCVLLFRIGDFYELFDDDAVAVSKAVGLTLTQRTEGVPMCGMPYHQLETYLRKLIDKGFRVAVCDQIQDAAEAKAAGGASAVIERAVTRVLTPGTLVDDTLLAPETPSCLAAVCFLECGDGSGGAAAVLELSTGRFTVCDGPATSLADEFARRGVSELLFSQTADGKVPARVEQMLSSLGLAGTPQPPWHFRPDEAREAVLKQFGVSSLAGFGLFEDDPGVRAAGAVIRYLLGTQAPGEEEAGRKRLAHVRPPMREDPAGFCTLDATSLRSLEVLRTMRSAPGAGDGEGSLLGVFSPSRGFAGCRTAMGKRLLREWLCRPLASRERIEARQRCVATLAETPRTMGELGEALAGVQDTARIAGRTALGRAGPRDVVALGGSLAQIRAIVAALDNAPAFAGHLERLSGLVDRLGPLSTRIAAVCVDQPPAHLREGGLVRDGVDAELDEARGLMRDAAGWMASYQARLIAAHDLPSLKVGYNKIFGYYIELPQAQSRRAPGEFTRKQTLKNAERYITPELKDFEQKAGSAEARALARETAIFEDLCVLARGLLEEIHAFGETAAELDVLRTFAEKAQKRGWVRPEITDDAGLVVHQGRHPVLDELLGSGFVPNDLELGGGRASLAIITGPNMAGKSTFIRTAALLTLLAHTGSFVPADRMSVGLTDRIFTRVGADDALHAGQSTFMVEMTETARILNHATPRSLVILDEIGRGTSTLDGLSLAWAIAETLAAGSGSGGGAGPGPRTLFATHYHELTELADLLPGRAGNLHVAVREWGDDVVFLHRILPGRTDRSYGIHVAKLAGLPPSTVARAREVLASLEVHHHGPGGKPPPGEQGGKKPGKRTAADDTLPLFTAYVQHPAIDRLRELKLEALSPMEAFDALRTLRGMADEK
jgi:DNA mismatch repair protein MutS